MQEQQNGSVLITFPDIPEALTEATTSQDATVEAEDCLVAALGGYVSARRTIPQPSQTSGHTTISLPFLIVAKIALHNTMLAQEVSVDQLADQLNTSEGSVHKLLDLDHHSYFEQIEHVLQTLS